MADSDPMMLGMDLPEVAPPQARQPYRVLARKYRPQTFAELIGQEAMVRTLGNAIKRDRIAHAFLMTGVRGVGKTSTARLIAKALNCIGPDGQGGPTIDPCNVCEPCRAIAEGRHIDVIEMDAASNTGVDDVREIIDAVRYSAVSARYKVYIVDEVHMLTKNAFNALLKTLEEPPPHVKFLFATTEVNKVPVTVLSRCQRFDLRRISAERLTAHFAEIARRSRPRWRRRRSPDRPRRRRARPATGSRSSTRRSLTDRARDRRSGALDAGPVGPRRRACAAWSAAGWRRARSIGALKDQYELGVEPAALLRSLLEAVHGITRVKVGGAARDPSQSEEEREAYADWAARLSYPLLHRLWQLLLKGLDEIARAPLPLEAAEMALLRVIHASQLPDPGELAAKLASGQAVALAAPASASSASPAAPAASQHPATFAAMVERLERGHAHLAQQLHDFAGVVSYAPPELALKLTRPLPTLARDLTAALKAVTGTAWQVRIAEGAEEAAPTLLEQEQDERARTEQEVLASPMVKAAMEAFPDAELAGYTAADRRS
jgi:DNA polymerase-3 subunit gamma/tau